MYLRYPEKRQHRIETKNTQKPFPLFTIEFGNVFIGFLYFGLVFFQEFKLYPDFWCTRFNLFWIVLWYIRIGSQIPLFNQKSLD